MATEQALQVISAPVAADFSTTGQFRFGSIDANGRLALTGAAEVVDGIVQDNPAAIDRAGALAISGVSMLELGGTVAAGGEIQSGASGVGVSGSTNARCTAMEAGVSGDIISVILK